MIKVIFPISEYPPFSLINSRGYKVEKIYLIITSQINLKN